MTVLRSEFGTRSAPVTPARPTVGAVPWGRRCCSSELGGTRTGLRASGKVQQPAAGDAPQLPRPRQVPRAALPSFSLAVASAPSLSAAETSSF